jgi:hypothetical protein
MKRWRRPLILIALLLLAGAVVNIAVAWVLVAGGQRMNMRSASGPGPDFHTAPKAMGAEFIFVGKRFYSARRHCLPPLPGGVYQFEEVDSYDRRVHASHPPPYEQECSGVVATGWPLLALRFSYTYTVDRLPMNGRQGGAAAPASWVSRGYFATTAGRLPTDPLVPGFAINTLFYPAILALPLSFFPIRRRLRARRGRCPKCGYDLAGLAGAERGGEGAAPCPECGAVP